LISNHLLWDHAQDDPMRAMGEISAVDQAILCMAQQNICSELLAYRLAYGPLHSKPTVFRMRRLLLALQRAGRVFPSRPVRAPIAGDL
jgi:hypothetical protein